MRSKDSIINKIKNEEITMIIHCNNSRTRKLKDRAVYVLDIDRCSMGLIG